MKKQVSVANLHVGPIRHPTLPDEFIERVRAFKEILGDVDPTSLEGTLDSFKRDTHPDNELVIWERIASTFQIYLSHNPTIDLAVRKEIFAVLVRASMGMEGRKKLTHLNDRQIEHLIANYRGLASVFP
jgi:hypothetical protein